MFDELRKDLRLGAPKTEVTVKYAMDLDLSKLSKHQVQLICTTLMAVSNTDVNLYYPDFIYNIITNNTDEACCILLEHLPLYITRTLSYPDNDYISDYQELQFKIQKYYVCEIVVKLLMYYYRAYHSTRDACYYHAKKAVKSLIQNIFEDLNCYEVVFLCSISDTIVEHIKAEKLDEKQVEQKQSMEILNNDIFCLLVTLMHNLNERAHGIVGFQKLQLVAQPQKEESKEGGPKSEQPSKAKQLIDQYFKIQSERTDSEYLDENTKEDISRINNSVMKLVLV